MKQSIQIQEGLRLLGYEVQDKVTKQTGVVCGISFDLYGCVQAVVNPGMDKDGKLREQGWFDINRLTVLGKNPVMEVPTFEFEKGPAEKPSLHKC